MSLKTLQYPRELSDIDHKSMHVLNKIVGNDEMQYSLAIIVQQRMHHAVAPLIEK
jgi:hypothetical protein